MKLVLKVTVDACILPGTMMGTELTLLYFKQWRRDYSALCLALLSLTFSLADVTFNSSLLSQTMAENEGQ
jgi:hypothetical protein